MKQIIVILATVALGVYIGAVLIFGGSDSFKKGAEDIRDEATRQISEMIDGVE